MIGEETEVVLVSELLINRSFQTTSYTSYILTLLFFHYFFFTFFSPSVFSGITTVGPVKEASLIIKGTGSKVTVKDNTGIGLLSATGGAAVEMTSKGDLKVLDGAVLEVTGNKLVCTAADNLQPGQSDVNAMLACQNVPIDAAQHGAWEHEAWGNKMAGGISCTGSSI